LAYLWLDSTVTKLREPATSVARELAIHITEATVKVHLKAMLRKIRVHNRTQAAI
jgi:DNA-binding NarL/FixJ family response regulator